MSIVVTATNNEIKTIYMKSYNIITKHKKENNKTFWIHFTLSKKETYNKIY